MDTYVGIQNQIRRNNFKSLLLLGLFPVVLFGMIWGFLYFTFIDEENAFLITNDIMMEAVPYILAGILIWFFFCPCPTSPTNRKRYSSKTA